MRILVLYASADGSTAGVADRIAKRLGRHGHDAASRPVSPAVGLDGVGAIVLGSAVHARQWLDEATTFVNTHHEALHELPLWTFSVGMPDAVPRAVRWMTRAEETGILDQLVDLRPRGHRLFSGVVAPGQFPLTTRIFLRLFGARYGDFRDWAAIDGWADGIAAELSRLAADPAPLRDV